MVKYSQPRNFVNQLHILRVAKYPCIEYLNVAPRMEHISFCVAKGTLYSTGVYCCRASLPTGILCYTLPLREWIILVAQLTASSQYSCTVRPQYFVKKALDKHLL
jgi:hypothetical protein